MKSIIRSVLVLSLITPASFAQITNPFPKPIATSKVKVGFEKVGDGFTMPLWLTHAGDGSGRLFAIDQPGTVVLIKDGKQIATPVLDVASIMVPLKKGFDERGLLGLAFHPGFADPKSPGHLRVYTYTSEPENQKNNDFPLKANRIDNQSVVAEWRFASASADTIDPSTRREILRFDQPQFNHDGGAISFGPDGMLYIATGDGGKAHDRGDGHTEPDGNAQDMSKVLGKILRIDPLGKSGNRRYGVPKDNPFVGKGSAQEIIWAYGLRNPFRMSFDRKTGQLIVGDVGQNVIEEIDIIVRGGNYGWRHKEGSFFFNSTPGSEGQIAKKPFHENVPRKMIDPVAEYDHDEGISVMGGFVYRGKAIKELEGLYVFGEWMKTKKEKFGRVMAADLKTGEITELVAAGNQRVGGFVTGMGEDESGEIYVLTSASVGPKGNTGKVHRLVPGK